MTILSQLRKRINWSSNERRTSKNDTYFWGWFQCEFGKKKLNPDQNKGKSSLFWSSRGRGGKSGHPGALCSPSMGTVVGLNGLLDLSLSFPPPLSLLFFLLSSPILARISFWMLQPTQQAAGMVWHILNRAMWDRFNEHCSWQSDLAFKFCFHYVIEVIIAIIITIIIIILILIPLFKELFDVAILLLLSRKL